MDLNAALVVSLILPFFVDVNSPTVVPVKSLNKSVADTVVERFVVCLIIPAASAILARLSSPSCRQEYATALAENVLSFAVRREMMYPRLCSGFFCRSSHHFPDSDLGE